MPGISQKEYALTLAPAEAPIASQFHSNRHGWRAAERLRSPTRGRAAVFEVVRARTISRLVRAGGGVELGRRKTNQRLLMSTPILDPSLPADHSPLDAGEMRGQFQAIEDSFADIRGRFLALTPLGLTVSNPPTQADVQALADKLDELINTLSA